MTFYTYRQKGDSAAMWLIAGEFDFISGNLKITINEETAILASFSSLKLNGEAKGSYKGYPVFADCKYNPKLIGLGSSYEDCIVKIDGEVASVVRIIQPGT